MQNLAMWPRTLTMTTAISLAVIGITVSPLPAQADWWSRNVAPLGPAIEQGAHDTGNAIEKGAHDTGKTIEKAVQDTGKAGETVYTFGVREIQGIGDSVRDADKRLKEGKFVDTI